MPDIIRNLGVTRILIIAGVTLSVVAFFVFLASRVARPDMALLYKDLELQDASGIVQMLEQRNIPYELRGDGREIYVARDQVSRMRMSAAEEGLPQGGNVGYEIFDRTDALGTTSFVQNINLVRALEGELSRTIGSLDRVEAARVHLVLPKREVFSREDRQPTASIMLKVRGTLGRERVSAIQNLVAAAVPGLEPGRVSVVDSRGNLLSRALDDGENALTAPSALQEIRLSQERRIKQSVEALLERIVGPGHVRAEVAVDIDHDRVTTNSETWDPDGQVVRSVQIREESNRSSEGNQADAVTVATNLPGQGQAQGNTQSTNEGATTEETTNYEISRSTKTEVREAGVVRRVSVAVLVDGITERTADGQSNWRPRTEQEIRELNSLVRSAVGYNEDRGDVVTVTNLRFADVDAVFEDAQPELEIMGFGKSEMMRMAEIVILGVVALLVMLLVVRPMLNRVLNAGNLDSGDETIALAGGGGIPALAGPSQARLGGGGGQLALQGGSGGGDLPALTDRSGGLGAESMIDINQVEGRVKESSLKKISEIVDKHPDEAVAIIRNWLYQDR
ncbi:MAG: flagellar basal-body MS-ring/collar protein FliF [Pseudomonadota bacterium]|nr:flagellar basal-body MS-ring/collar protein FliF [Pseudomonadota bacterium]